MSINQSEEHIEEILLNDGAKENVQSFVEKYKNILIGGTVAVFAAVLLGWGYMALYKKPQEKNAQVQMIRAQQYFEQDSFRLALNGDGNYLGFEAIINQYGSTNAGNGAKLYAGISALQTGEFQKAITFLEAFKTSDALLNARKFGCIGDANAELNNMEAAASNYEKAVSAAPENDITAPSYMQRLAKVQELLGKKEDAVKTFTKLADEFPNSFEGSSAEKEAARIQATL